MSRGVEILFRRHFAGIHFEKLEAAVAGVLRFIEAISHLQAADQQISGSHQGKVTSRGWSERSAYYGGVIETRDGGRNVEFMTIPVKKLDGDARMRPRSCILEGP